MIMSIDRGKWLFVIFLLTATVLGYVHIARVQPLPGPAPAPPVILEFGRKLCPVCRNVEQILFALQKESKNQFELRLLYMDEDIKLFRQYHVSIVPTQVFLDTAGKEVWRHEGRISRDQLVKKLRELKFIKD